MSIQESRRSAFGVYCDRRGISRDPDDRRNAEHWFAWNASLDSVVVVLPRAHLEFDGDPAPELFERDVVQAITAAGIRVEVPK